jgi:Ca2+-transporting ATPase
VIDGGMSGRFPLNPDKLYSLVDPKNPKLVEELGGVNSIADSLRSSCKDGLPAGEVDKISDRRDFFGKNTLPKPPSKTFMELVVEALKDPTLVMLCIAAAVSLVLGIIENPATGWIEGCAILIAVVIVVIVGSGNDYQKERQFRKLNEKKQDRDVSVIRCGEERTINVVDLVVGDVLVVQTGDIMPVDCVFIHGANIKCDESQATGESDEMAKDTVLDPIFISGSKVLDGNGRALVVCVGENSFNGRLMMSLQVETEDTPLQQKLDILAEQIGQLGLYSAVGTVIILVIKYLLILYIYNLPFQPRAAFSILLKYVITAITIVVVAVPEGLPLAVTIALAYSTVKMLADNNLVRQLAACETMGGATDICSDKTGTLTQNRMTVVDGVVAGVNFDTDSLMQGDPSRLFPAQALDLLSEGIALNSTATETRNDEGVLEFTGNKTETALLELMKKFPGVKNYKTVRATADKKAEIPFSSARKRMSVVIGKGLNTFRVHAKGASEIMLGRCTYALSGDGTRVPFTQEMRAAYEDKINKMATNALRTICLAYQEYYKEEEWGEQHEEGLVCIGIVGIKDPLRDEVVGAVQTCQRAGITVRMVTGDNLVTAINIAKNAGIYTEGGLAMEGPEFRKMTEVEMDAVVGKLQVLARSSPTDKQKLVERLMALDHVVAVTGDGTNDGPALKKANVGFSMGIAGTEVAKEASDVVLMDDNFASIVKAVLWGRNVNDSIRKFLQFQLTVNVVAVVLAFIGAVTMGSGESPLKPVQLLWVNLIMDTMAALALATDDPVPELLNRKPQGKKESLITESMWMHIIVQAIYQLVVNLALLHLGHILFGVPKGSTEHLTIIFNSFVLCQVFNEVNCRRINPGEFNILDKFFTNVMFIGVLFFTVIMQYMMVEFGGEFASTVSLSAEQWFVCVMVGFGSMPISMAVRTVTVPDNDDISSKLISGATSAKFQ